MLPTSRLFISVSLGLLASCATIISGTTQAVSIDSNVSGASVIIDGSNVGRTPFSGKIKRQRETIAMVRKEGYVAQSFTMSSSFNPVAILSILWDYSTTDFLTGAVWEYSPSQYYIELAPEEGNASLFRERTTLKAVAMTFHSDLLVELAAGEGQLLTMIHERFLADRSQEAVVEQLQQLTMLGAKEFGEAVATLHS